MADQRISDYTVAATVELTDIMDVSIVDGAGWATRRASVGVLQDRIIHVPDGKKITLGTGEDAEIYCDGDDLYIENVTSNKDIYVRVLDGAVTRTVIFIDGSLSRVQIPDLVSLTFGSGDDGRINASTGSLFIENRTVDKDIYIRVNDGGVETTVIFIDGSESFVQIRDSVKLTIGSGNDGQIYSSGDDLYFDNVTQDKDIYIRVNDGGVTRTVIFIDGSESRVAIGRDFTSPLGILHVQYSDANEAPYFERTSTVGTNSTLIACYYKAKTTQDMVDGFGAALFMTAEDSANVNNVIGGFAFARDGADNQGEFIVAPYTAGSPNFRLRLKNTGRLYLSGLNGAAPGGNPAVYWDSATGELYYDSSSVQFKENISDLLPTDIEYLKNIKCRKYDRKAGLRGEHGFVSEEIQPVNNKLVSYIAKNRDEINIATSINAMEGGNVAVPNPIWELASVDKAGMIPDLVLAYQILLKEIEELKKRR